MISSGPALSGPLAGVVVVDLSQALAGPHAAMMLGDLGARVIKVERPGVGDQSRSWGPPFVQGTGDPESTYFLSCNRNKESVCLDLTQPGDRDRFEVLLAKADVLVENLRPGALERLGLATSLLSERYSRLIILSITGFGEGGPESARPGYDQILQGEAGVMSVTGRVGCPTRVGLPISDILAGLHGVCGVVAALYDRSRSGRGQVVHTSLLASVIGAHAFQGARYTVAREVPGPTGDHHPSICPYGMFTCGDGVVQLAVGSESLWQTFAEAFGLPVAAPGFATNAERVANRDAVVGAITDAFASMKVDGIVARLSSLGVPAGRVRTLDEVYEWSQTRSQGLVIRVDHATLGEIELPGPPIRFSRSTRVDHEPPPVLGAHSREVEGWMVGTALPLSGPDAPSR